MKTNQIKDIIKGGASAIMKEVALLQSGCHDNRLKAARGEVKNVRKNKTARRTIARLLTAKEML